MLIKMTALASALSGLVYTSLPAPAPLMAPDAPNEALQQKIALTLDAGREVPPHALVFERVDVDALMGAPVVDTQERFVGYVAQLMVAENGRIEGLVLGLERGLPSAYKEIAIESDEVDVLRAMAGGYVVKTDDGFAALNNAPEFVPEYESASASGS